MANVKPSKGVTDRQKSSLKVQATREHLDVVGDALVKRFPRGTRAAAKAAVVLLVGLLIDWLKNATDAMVAADAANALEQSDDAALRERRDTAAAEVREVLIDLRSVLATFFGDAVLAPFGIAGETPDDPVVLERAGTAVLAQLRVFDPPPARRRSMTFDRAEWIQLLEQPVADLGRALEEVAKDERQNQLAVVEKTRAIAAYDFAFRATANFLTGLFVAAGRDQLASRVRPSTRRPGQTAEDAPQVSGRIESNGTAEEDAA